jgi:UDP-glucose/GDP-mannose dehydrogenase family, NAD binding domain
MKPAGIARTGAETLKQPYLVDVLSRKQKRQVTILIVLWGISAGVFTEWWFQPKHIADPWLFAFNTFVLGWGIIMPAYYFYFLRRMKKPNPELSIPVDWRLAMVVTRDFHGSLQAGYNRGFVPMFIGSHYAMRRNHSKCWQQVRLIMDIAVIYSEYVGLATRACFERVGHRVICVDIES